MPRTVTIMRSGKVHKRFGGRASKANATHSVGALTYRKQSKSKKRFGQKVQSALTKIAEKKTIALSAVFAAADSNTGVLLDISALVVPGTTDQTRIGDSIFTRSIELNYAVTSITADQFNMIRVLIFIWKPTSTPVVTDVLQFGNGTVIAPLSPYNHDRRDDFFILYDKLHMMPYKDAGAGLVSVTSNSAQAKMNLIYKIPSFLRKVQYVATTAVGNNHVYMLFYGDSAVAPHPQFAYSLKYNYSDF